MSSGIENQGSFPVVRGLGFPVRNLFCIGRNYAEHAKELNNPAPKQPVVFLKPTSSICYSGEFIEIPESSTRVDHEIEVIVAIGNHVPRGVSRADALKFVAGYGLGIDVTARDLQEQAKQKALPWTLAKGFDTFAVLGDCVPAARVTDPALLRFGLDVNGARKQTGQVSDMIFDIPTLISYLASAVSLDRGDLIFTGTPAGVSPLQPGDRLEGFLELAGEPLARIEAGVRKGRIS